MGNIESMGFEKSTHKTAYVHIQFRSNKSPFLANDIAYLFTLAQKTDFLWTPIVYDDICYV